MAIVRPKEAYHERASQEMEKHLPTLEGWDVEHLKANCKKVQLGT